MAIAVLLLAVLAGGLGLLQTATRPAQAPAAAPPPRSIPEPARVQPGTAVPQVEEPAPAPAPAAGAADPVRAWADEIAAVQDIPARAVVSYVNAELAMRHYQPECGISWTTLGGIGRIESDHGRFGTRQLDEDARPSAPIIGVALDGVPGVQQIPDTDGGALDGDPQWDRAVGPMQFIPSTWAKWATDGTGDGKADPQNLDDAAVTAGRYLCANGRDMSSGEGWWSGVLGYNNSVEYAQQVYALAEGYAAAGGRRD
nr:lytic murein transglycosylase [Saccharopolyspora sp. HNM0983]